MIKRNPSDRPEPAQITALKDLGIEAPATRYACSITLDWIEKGGNERNRRIAILVEANRIWLGKKVMSENSFTGTIKSIMPKTPESIRQLYYGKQYRSSGPLFALVYWDTRFGGGKSTYVSVDKLRLSE